MKYTRSMTYNQITSTLLGKRAHFLAECELFPNFDVTGKVMSHRISNNGELILVVKTSTGKSIDIGTNMTGLKFDIL